MNHQNRFLLIEESLQLRGHPGFVVGIPANCSGQHSVLKTQVHIVSGVDCQIVRVITMWHLDESGQSGVWRGMLKVSRYRDKRQCDSGSLHEPLEMIDVLRR